MDLIPDPVDQARFFPIMSAIQVRNCPEFGLCIQVAYVTRSDHASAHLTHNRPHLT